MLKLFEQYKCLVFCSLYAFKLKRVSFLAHPVYTTCRRLCTHMMTTIPRWMMIRARRSSLINGRKLSRNQVQRAARHL